MTTDFVEHNCQDNTSLDDNCVVVVGDDCHEFVGMEMNRRVCTFAVAHLRVLVSLRACDEFSHRGFVDEVSAVASMSSKSRNHFEQQIVVVAPALYR